MREHELSRLARRSLAAALLLGATGFCFGTAPARAAGPGMGSCVPARPMADTDDKKATKKDDAPPGDPVDIDKLPKAVVTGLKKAMPGARIVKALKLPDGNYFLDDVKVGKKEYDVTISPEGKILKSVEQPDN